MENNITRIISYFLHPLFIPLYSLAFIFLYPDLYPLILPIMVKLWILAATLIFTLIIPVAGVLLVAKGFFSENLELNKRAQRHLPLALSITSYMILIWLLRNTLVPPLFIYVLYSATIALAFALIINMFYKISLHALGWSALSVVIFRICLLNISVLPLLIACIGITGLVGYARLKQNAHNIFQVMAGYMAGTGIIALFSFLL